MPSSDSTLSSRHVPRRILLSWIFRVTRPVLSPLLASSLCRIADLLAGVGLFALSAFTVVTLGIDLSAGTAPEMPWKTLAFMAGLAALKALLRYGEQFLGHLVAFKSLELLRAEIYEALIPRSPRVMAVSRSGDLLSRATKDVDRIEVFFAHTFAPLVSAFVVPVTVVALIGVKGSWLLGLVAFCFLFASIALAPTLGWKASLRSSRAVASERARLVQHVTDSIQGMSEVVGYRRMASRLEDMASIDRSIGEASKPAIMGSALRRAFTQALTLGAPIVLLALGLPLVQAGSLSAPMLAAIAAAVLRLTETARGVEELAAALGNSFAAAERVYRTVHSPVEVPDGALELPAAPSHEIRWENVTYSYPKAAQAAVRDINICARAGEWTCLVGASGSGKSTLAQLLLRFDDPQSGRITIDGFDVSTLTRDSLSRELTLVTQKAHLFRASVLDNVRLAAPCASEEEVREACRIAGIDADIKLMPQEYQTMLGERGSAVSGGQRQRLALARAILARPSTLVLDEFTSHLDAELAASVRGAVRECFADATVIEITHRLDVIDEVDRVVVIDGGRVVQDGTPGELWAVEGPLRTLAARGL
ncbi:amino acid ABC transporter ATP-binding/permease protein [Schaalia cardiffensis]|uniref:amino acid ABC transporter ATP-binding/permease protein n=1 Tax=Schaalia cardiffensis TaxID=181487 RepID=UPI0023F1D620|nr:ABC transporter ATP-binding protein [Schaalia cardiffensis]